LYHCDHKQLIMNIPAKAHTFAQTVFSLTVAEHGRMALNLQEFIKQELNKNQGKLSPDHANAILSGNANRQLTAWLQLLATDAGLDSGLIDGFWGPQTDFAFNSLLFLHENGALPPFWRDYVPLNLNPNNWPLEKEADLITFYGQPCDESSLVLIDLPYEHRLAWDLSTKVRRTRCHSKVADSIVRVLDKVKAHYGEDKIKELRLDRFGGCYNPRRKRGGTQWSTHAWGIALDFDPDRNQLQWGRDRAHFAKAEYEPWWTFWEEEGWVSLGRKSNFDWMHVQAAR
jgi:hypothetical protein